MTQSKTVLTFATEAEASAAAEVIGALPEMEAFPLVLYEDGKRWNIDLYDDGFLASEAQRGGMALRAIEASGVSLLEAPLAKALPQEDWVTLTQAGLPPVCAGKFIIHGSHDRGRVFSSRAVEIDAGRAFGTAHHATTRGCIMALDRYVPIWRPRRILDLGTGTGVLSIVGIRAASHRARAWAIDVDAAAVEVARHNFKLNAVKAFTTASLGDGSRPFSGAPFDLVAANILARPLIHLAGRIRSCLRPGGGVILSGLLNEQAREVLATYLARGFRKERVYRIEGWTAAVLIRTS
jgi:ribosomal protein L11 methyltransferase